MSEPNQGEPVPGDAPKPAVTVVLIDDDDDCRMLVREALQLDQAEPTIVEASNGVEGLRVLRERFAGLGHKPALIFLDMEMPGLDGLETLRQIRQDPHLRDIPVVILSGVDDSATIRRAVRYGANSYTLKPSNADRFFQTILESSRYWLKVHQYPTSDQEAA